MTIPQRDNNAKPLQKRKRPLWPWLVLLVLTLMAIYAHQQISMMIEDFTLLGRDLVQLGRWIASFFPDN